MMRRRVEYRFTPSRQAADHFGMDEKLIEQIQFNGYYDGHLVEADQSQRQTPQDGKTAKVEQKILPQRRRQIKARRTVMRNVRTPGEARFMHQPMQEIKYEIGS